MHSSTKVKSTKLPDGEINGFLSRIPFVVLVVAVLAALLHMMPFWRAQSQVPPGWTFTGNLSISPDYMQYRVWSRRSQQTGILVDNSFTGEPNRPHLPVIFYFAVGKISAWINTTPEFVFAYSGCVFAFGLTILLFATVRHFLRSSYQTWWIFLTILIGGGLGAHLRLLTHLDVVKNNFILRRTIVEGLWNSMIFEDYRSHYIFITLFDTHFLLIWLAALASVVSLYFTLRKLSLLRIVLTVFLYIVTMLLHVYEGVTLIMITAAVTFLCWRKRLVIRPAIITLVICILSVTAGILWQLSLYRSSGLPVPSWRAVNILFLVLLIAYPLAWLLIFWGLADYWRKAGLKECFLLGWMLGCTVLTLSGPFYPYPDRGTMTLQIPIYIVAGAIYFSRYARITWLPALVAILVLSATPAWMLGKKWTYTRFNPNAPYMFMSAEHREIVDLLRNRATENDLLMVDKSDFDWETDDLWLAPEYPGKLYCSHFFLTVNYNYKRDKVIRFFESNDPEEQAAFLRREGIRFLYVNARKDPRRFENVPGLVLLKAASIGSLFKYTFEISDIEHYFSESKAGR